MKFIVVGLNHRTAPVEIREKLAIPETKLDEALKTLVQSTGLQETVIISTCNRSEVYALLSADKEQKKVVEEIKNFFANYRQIARQEFEDKLYIYQDHDCLKHLFEVSAGLDSMVVGEDQILGQVKTAYLQAKQSNTTGKMFNILFQKALNLGKAVRSCTGINRGSISVGSVAVELAEKIFGNLSGKEVMIIGAGKMGEVTIKHLVSHGIKSILVTNRTYSRAQELARKFSTEGITSSAVRFDEYPAYLETVDIVISSTAAPGFILFKKDILPIMHRRKHRALFLIDIAVPRDIEPEVNNIDNVYLYNIDDLEQIVQTNLKEREKEIQKCYQMVNEKTAEVITAMKSTMTTIF